MFFGFVAGEFSVLPNTGKFFEFVSGDLVIGRVGGLLLFVEVDSALSCHTVLFCPFCKLAAALTETPKNPPRSNSSIPALNRNTVTIASESFEFACSLFNRSTFARTASINTATSDTSLLARILSTHPDPPESIAAAEAPSATAGAKALCTAAFRIA